MGRIVPLPVRAAMLLAIACLAACSDAPGGAGAQTFQHRSVLRDFALEPGSWEVLEHPSDVPPAPRVITPAVSIETDSADRPSIRLAPPSRVRIRIPDEQGPLYLRAAAGVDRSSRKTLPRSVEAATIGFDLSVDGEAVFREEIRYERSRAGVWDPQSWVWHHLRAGEGIAVRPGAIVEFGTRWVEPPLQGGAPPFDPARVVAGFGGLFLERRVERARTRASPEAPNLVLVVMDTLRADHLGCYGYERPTSPHLDRLAERGLRFERAFSTASWTFPATASILTGLPPESHGVVSNEACTLHQGCATIAEVVQARGFTTAAFCANPLISPERYFDQGFETFVVAPGGGSRPSGEIVPQALEWLEGNARHRFFLYLHLADPHTPHRPEPEEAARLGLPAPPAGWPEGGLNALTHDPGLPFGGVEPELRQYACELYDACVASGDLWFGAVVEKLEGLGVLDRTVIAFTADHGEELLDRGEIGHGHGVHRELVRVPLVLAGPGIPAGKVVQETVSNRHLATTLAILGSGELDASGTGRFLLEPLPGQAAFSSHRARWGGTTRPAFALRTAEWMLQWTGKPTEAVTGVQLFDLVNDPDELVDVSASHPRTAAKLRAGLALQLKAERALRPAVVLGAGGGGMEDLIELGYVDRATVEQPGDER